MSYKSKDTIGLKHPYSYILTKKPKSSLPIKFSRTFLDKDKDKTGVTPKRVFPMVYSFFLPTKMSRKIENAVYFLYSLFLKLIFLT